ncbi:MAG TPA: hypothetical protein VF070_43290 [Streptosporangiaceae bacterium]
MGLVVGRLEVAEGVLDALPVDVVLAVDALGVDLEQDGDAVACPFCSPDQASSTRS